MPGGMRVYTDDPEKDPEYGDALARYVAGPPATSPTPAPETPETPEQMQARRSAEIMDFASRGGDLTPFQTPRAPSPPAPAPLPAGGAPPPMTQPAAALRSMMDGASMPSRAEQIAKVTAEGGDLTPFLTQPSPDARPAPTRIAPTAAGTAQLQDLQEAGRASIPAPATNMATLGLRGLLAGAKRVPDLLMWANNMRPPDAPAEDATVEAPPPVEAPRLAALSGTPPPVPTPAPTRTVQVGRPARVQVANALTAQSHAPPVPSGDIPPGALTGPSSSVPPAALARAREVLGPAPQRPDPLQLALAASRGDRLIANLTRAGGTAIGRGTGPGYDALDEGADRPLQEMGLIQQQADKAKAEAAANGPLSPAEQSVYGKLLAQAGVNLDPAMLAKLPAGRVRALIPDLEKMGQLEATRADKAAALKQAATEAEQNRQNHLDVARLAHAGTAGLREDRLQEQKDKRLDQEVERLGKDVEPLTKLKPDLSYLRGVASKTGDIAGTGVLASRAPDWMLSDEGVKTRQALLRVANAYLREQSGTAVTPSEAERFLKSRGMGEGATARSLRTGLQELLPEFEAMAQSRISRHTPEAVREYKTRGGETDYSLGGAPGPKTISSDAEYDALPSGAEFIGPDGKHRRKP